MQGKTDLHRELKTGTFGIELIANLPVFCKIKTVGAISPCVIRLQKLSSLHNDMELFISLKHKLPDEDLCEWNKVGARRMVIEEPVHTKKLSQYDDIFFQKDWIFLRLESAETMSTRIKIGFGKNCESGMNEVFTKLYKPAEDGPAGAKALKAIS
jgi:hypothetical protein